MLSGIRVWNRGDVLHVVDVYISCEVGGVFQIGEYEDG